MIHEETLKSPRWNVLEREKILDAFQLLFDMGVFEEEILIRQANVWAGPINEEPDSIANVILGIRFAAAEFKDMETLVKAMKRNEK